MKPSTKITKVLLIACCALFAQCGNHEHAAAIDTAQANMRATEAQFAVRSFHHASEFSSACGEICLACAADCDRLAKGDAMMKQYAEICRKCAESCQKMANTKI